MKARATEPFDDLKEGVSREAGDVFEVTEERFKELNSTQYGNLVERVAERRRPAKAKQEA